MREIKFRAWDLREGKMCFLHEMRFDFNREAVDFEISEKYLSGPIDTRKDGDDMYLMQFTGLKDKNGKEIYEGDLVKAIYQEVTEEFEQEATLHVCAWHGDQGYPAFDLDPVNKTDDRISDEVNCFSYCIEGDGPSLEVIGNIYENPKLLSGSGSEK